MAKGERIKALREKMGYSQTEFAERVKISKQTLYKYENNIISNIPSDVIERMASILNCPPGYFMGWEDPETETGYYLDPESAELADFAHKNPEYKALFDASRKVKPEDINFVLEMIKRTSNYDD